MSRFLCTGDLHIGVGADLGREPGERLAEQEAVWARVVALASELDVDAILFAGDAFEGPIPTPEHYRAFTRPLDGSGIHVYAITGNGRHDAAMRSSTALDVAHAQQLYVYSQPWVEFNADLPTLALLPWAPVSRIVAAEGGGDRDEINQRVAAGVVEIARGLYAQACEHDRPKILVAHWSVGSAVTSSGIPVDLFREPVLPLEDLEAIGFDAIVLGHIHVPQMLNAGPAPIFYVGSPMPLNFGEAASEHCVWLLDIDREQASAYKIPVESRPLVQVTLDGQRSDDERRALEAPPGVGPESGIEALTAALELVDVGDAIVKVKARGTAEQARRWDLAGLKRNLEALGAHKVWQIAPEVERADVARGVTVDAEITDHDAMRRWLELNCVTLGIDGDRASDLLDTFDAYVHEATAA